MSSQLKFGLVAIAVVGAFVLGLLVGSSGSAGGGSESSSVTPQPVTEGGTLDWGQKAKSPQGNTITAFSYDPSARIAGRNFGQADVEWCAGQQEGVVSFIIPLWSVQTDQGQIAAESVGYTNRSLGKNELLRLDPGDCVRGLLEFDVPDGATAQTLVFSGTAVYKWTIEPGSSP